MLRNQIMETQEQNEKNCLGTDNLRMKANRELERVNLDCMNGGNGFSSTTLLDHAKSDYCKEINFGTSNITGMSRELQKNSLVVESLDLKDADNPYLLQIEMLKLPIIETFNLENLNKFEDYTSRFYTEKYCVNFNIDKLSSIYHDILVKIHSNGALLIALAPGNTIMQSSKQITEINFTVNKKDRSNIKIKGKKKFGAKLVKKETIICQVKLEGDPTFYNIRSGVEGRLVEINELVKTNPNIMKTEPKRLGYICIILPNAPKDKVTETLVNLELYNEKDYLIYLSKRSLENSCKHTS